MTSSTVHASAVLFGARAILIRGPSGAGKSRLALDLLAAGAGRAGFKRLVGDDRVHLRPAGGRLLVSPAAALAGLIEVRGLGIMRLDYEPCAVVGLVVDLDAKAVERLPEHRFVKVDGINLPRFSAASSIAALSGVLALLTSSATGLEAAFSFEVC